MSSLLTRCGMIGRKDDGREACDTDGFFYWRVNNANESSLENSPPRFKARALTPGDTSPNSGKARTPRPGAEYDPGAPDGTRRSVKSKVGSAPPGSLPRSRRIPI